MRKPFTSVPLLWRTSPYLHFATPSRLQCLHSYCGHCMRKVFENQLRPRLQAIDVLSLYREGRYDCQAIPTNIEHLRATVTVIQLHAQEKAEDIFKYECPFCRAETPIPPYQNSYKTKDFFSDVEAALGLKFTEEEMACEEGVERPDFFDGLFLSKDMYYPLPVRRHPL